MRIIPTRIHGIIDYATGGLLMVLPWLLYSEIGGAALWVPFTLGGLVVVYSLLTDYELGLMRGLSMKTHLLLDLLGGGFLAVSPWLFGFNDVTWAPHFLIGVMEIAVAAMTYTIPDEVREHHTEREYARRHHPSGI